MDVVANSGSEEAPKKKKRKMEIVYDLRDLVSRGGSTQSVLGTDDDKEYTYAFSVTSDGTAELPTQQIRDLCNKALNPCSSATTAANDGDGGGDGGENCDKVEACKGIGSAFRYSASKNECQLLGMIRRVTSCVFVAYACFCQCELYYIY